MVNILYCFDENYNKQAATSISSLSNKIDEKINIYIIHKNPISFKEIKSKLENLNFINSINIYKFNDNNYEFPNLSGSHVSSATYFRLFIENYLPSGIKFITYIDADVVCINNPINEINRTIKQMKKENYFIAGRVEGTNEISKDYFDNLGFKGKKYFNAGVVVIDYQKWIDSNMKNELLEIMKEKYDQIIYWDQDVLNSYYKGEFLELKDKLNYKFDLDNFSEELHDFVEREVCFLHYSGNGKPWNFDSVRKQNSIFYQDAFYRFFNIRYHTEIKLKKYDFIKLLRLFFNKKNKNSIPLTLFCKNLFILFRKLLNYYIKS
tara:strand:+ start:4217 stop:5179 length:963 start_codon:yes stop_codon:yes gene_type:complete